MKQNVFTLVPNTGRDVKQTTIAARSKLKEIANSDEEVISDELLSWSGLWGIWRHHGLHKLVDFTEAIADHCDHIDIDRTEMDDGDGNYTRVWVIVETDDEEELKREMETRVRQLIKSRKKK